MKRVAPPDPEALARAGALADRQLSPDEVRAALAIPLGEAEEEESRSLIRWFRRRYPTPAERLAYARRAYRRWTAAAASGEVPQVSERLAKGLLAPLQ